MQDDQVAPLYRVWGADNVAYGPVELPILINWVQDERVTPTTYVFADTEAVWRKASDIPELKVVLQRQAKALRARGDTAFMTAPGHGIKPGTLRRIKILASMEEKQLESFIHYMEVVRCRQFSHVVRKGEHGDAMFLVLEGELRALTMVDGKESTLSTMTAGDFFGEISLLDQGPRSADVVANLESVLLKISSSAFDRLVAEAPALALPFLLALSRSFVGRMRNLTKRYEDSVHFSRALGGRGQ